MNKQKIILGDCVEQIPLLANDYDICFTSPPYNLFNNNFVTEGKTRDDIQKYNSFIADKIDNGPFFMEKVILGTLEKCKYFFLNVQSLANNKKDIITLLYNLQDYYCDVIIWDKGNGIPNGFNKRVMTASFEYIYIFSKKPSRAIGTKEGKGTVSNVIKINGNHSNRYAKKHRALFPVDLPLFILQNFVKPGGKVLDIFSGLGTTGVACKLMNMEYTGIEIVEEYVELSKDRLLEVVPPLHLLKEVNND